MAPKSKATKKQPKSKSQVDKALKEKADAALQRERQQVIKSQEARLQAMQDELKAWFQSHPQAFEYIHRGCFLGTFDNLDNPASTTAESGSAKLAPYQNKFRLLSKERELQESQAEFDLSCSVSVKEIR